MLSKENRAEFAALRRELIAREFARLNPRQLEGALATDDLDAPMRFGRARAVLTYVPGKPVTAGDASLFDGTWRARYVSSANTNGAIVTLSESDVENLGMETLTLEIRDGQVRMTQNGSIEAFDFADGVLSIEGQSPRALTLLEDPHARRDDDRTAVVVQLLRREEV